MRSEFLLGHEFTAVFLLDNIYCKAPILLVKSSPTDVILKFGSDLDYSKIGSDVAYGI